VRPEYKNYPSAPSGISWEELINRHNPAIYESDVPGAAATFYFESPKISVAEGLFTGPATQDSRLVFMVPPDGQVQGMNLVWQGIGSMAPRVTATKISAEHKRASFDFYSGIAFATAASALLAGVQEVPRRSARENQTAPHGRAG
jgi:hypothetical protein